MTSSPKEPVSSGASTSSPLLSLRSQGPAGWVFQMVTGSSGIQWHTKAAPEQKGEAENLTQQAPRPPSRTRPGPCLPLPSSSLHSGSQGPSSAAPLGGLLVYEATGICRPHAHSACELGQEAPRGCAANRAGKSRGRGALAWGPRLGAALALLCACLAYPGCWLVKGQGSRVGLQQVASQGRSSSWWCPALDHGAPLRALVCASLLLIPTPGL